MRSRSTPASWTRLPALDHDSLVGEVRGLCGAERALLAVLEARAASLSADGARQELVSLVTQTGARLARLETVCGLLAEEASGRQSGDIWRIFDAYLPGAPSVDSGVRRAAREALAYLSTVYALAESRARTLRMSRAARLLHASLDEARAQAALVTA